LDEWFNKDNGSSGSLNGWNIITGSTYYTYDMDGDTKTELFCISPDNKYEKILNYVESSAGAWQSNWGNAGSYQIYNREVINSDRFFFGDFTTAKSGPEVLWIKKSWDRCSNTHAYVHQMPEFIVYNRSSNKNKQSNSEQELELTDKFRVFPNPNTGKFMINSETMSLFNITMYNSLGKQIMSKQKAEEPYQIDLSDFPKGLYIIKINANGISEFQKVVKQ